jgi:2-keto-4-pentenoate hydratase/2-oxohepta-3-ene-1,7-dioic acid hydratase in catechol pathway
MSRGRRVKIVRFRAAGKTRYGALEGPRVAEYAGTPYGAFRRARKTYPLRQIVLLAPVLPSKVVVVGPNYRDRADSPDVSVSGDPPFFIKPISALCGPDDPIVFPSQAGRVDYEAELAIVIKKRCRQVPAERAREYVLGYTCLNDVTARDVQARDGQPGRAKSFDSFCPVGPCIATDIDPNSVDIEAYLNGEKKQSSNTKQLILPVENLVSRVSSVMTLLPGDVIATGTPVGSGPMRPGDKVEVRIEGIGSLKNPVVKI